jgi:hypothetical protein
MRAADFERWMRGAQPGDRTIYHEGRLSADRLAEGRKGRRVSILADYVYAQSEIATPIVSKCFHCRGETPGAGRVRLFSERKRDDPGSFFYFAEKTGG